MDKSCQVRGHFDILVLDMPCWLEVCKLVEGNVKLSLVVRITQAYRMTYIGGGVHSVRKSLTESIIFFYDAIGIACLLAVSLLPVISSLVLQF